MITLLSKICIQKKNPKDLRKFYGTLCGCIGIVLNVLLFAGKYTVSLLSGSIAMAADAFNNLSDAASSIITLIGFRFAGKKADSDHPFGHGRYEYIAGFVVSLLILLMGIELAQSAIRKIIHPQEMKNSNLALFVLLISILVKCYMYFYNRQIGKKIQSGAMLATATDSLSDAVATTVVLVSVLINRYTGMYVDGYCGLLVSLFVLYAGCRAAKDTISPLLGTLPDPQLVEQIEKIVKSYDQVVGMHDLVIHDYGPGRVMISLHAEVPGDGNIFVLHDMIDRLEQQINLECNCETVVHMDPIALDDEEMLQVREMVAQKLKELDEDITIHDFRMVKVPTHTNLIFDAVVPFSCKIPDGEIKERICEKNRELNPQFCTVVYIDKMRVR